MIVTEINFICNKLGITLIIQTSDGMIAIAPALLKSPYALKLSSEKYGALDALTAKFEEHSVKIVTTSNQ